MPGILRQWILGSLCAVAVFEPSLSFAQNRSERGARTSSLDWVDVPLGEGLERIGGNYRAAVLLDRRVDPTKRISLTTTDADIGATVQQAATTAGLGTSQVAALYYVGPTPTAEHLRTLVALRNEDVARLPPANRTELMTKRPLVWPRRAEPRLLIANVASQRGWRVANANAIPHDLWRAGGLPTMTFSEQLTVLLVGFDLTFNLAAEKKTVEIVSLAEPLPLVARRYPLRYGAADAERLRQQFPTLGLKIEGDVAHVDGRIEEHERVAEWLAGPQSRAAVRSPAAPGVQVFTLRVEEKPVRTVMTTLSQRLNWQLHVDEAALQAAGLSFDRRVSFDVKDASEEELLRAVLRPAGLDFRKTGSRVEILAAKKEQ